MAIKRIHDDLPPAGDLVTDNQTHPDRNPRFGPLLAQKWERHHKANPLPRAHPDARFRHSDAGNCARALGYAAIDLPESNPMDLAGFWVVELGHMIHRAWQEALQETYPDAEIEVKVHEGRRAGHIDAVVRIPRNPDQARPYWAPEEGHPPYVIAIEGKSVGGYAYQLAVGARGLPEGPKDAHVVQAALHGRAVDADEIVVVYWSRDAISIQQAERKPQVAGFTRITAEWTFQRDDYEPIAAAEVARVDSILQLVDEGTLPARKIPGLPTRSIVVRPSEGVWVQYDAEGRATGKSGSAWQCAYCRHQQLCSLTKPGRIPTVDAYDAVAKLGLAPGPVHGPDGSPDSDQLLAVEGVPESPVGIRPDVRRPD